MYKLSALRNKVHFAPKKHMRSAYNFLRQKVSILLLIMCIIGIFLLKNTFLYTIKRRKDSFKNLYFIICAMNLTIQINNFNKKCVFLSKNLNFFVVYLLNFLLHFLFDSLYAAYNTLRLNTK